MDGFRHAMQIENEMITWKARKQARKGKKNEEVTFVALWYITHHIPIEARAENNKIMQPSQSDLV